MVMTRHMLASLNKLKLCLLEEPKQVSSFMTITREGQLPKYHSK
jgi:hypothetical protein